MLLPPPPSKKPPDKPAISLGFSRKNIPDELNSQEKWTFLDNKHLPNLTITRRKIKASDDLPATDSGWWLIRNEILRRPWESLFQKRNIAEKENFSIHPPGGWFSDWSKTKYRYETSVLYPQPTFWWRLAQQFQRMEWLRKIKEAGINCWVPYEQRKAHKKEVFAVLNNTQEPRATPKPC